MNRPTDEQVRAAVRKFTTPAADTSLAELINSARSRATEVVTSQSCYRSYDIYKYLGRYVAPKKSPELVFASPMVNLTYHDKNACLSVERVDNFKSVAKNAISFRVVFVSDSSGESKNLNYTMIRQADGEWLFSRAGR